MSEFLWKKITSSFIHSFIHLKYPFKNTVTTDFTFTVEVLYLEDGINISLQNFGNTLSDNMVS
jgi:hypothetical protein